MGRKPKRLKEIEEAETFKDKVYNIINNEFFDPENGPDEIVKLVRKIMKDEISKIEKQFKIANDNKNFGLAASYGSLIYALEWILNNKFDIKKMKI